MAETKVPPTAQEEDDYTPDLITLEDEDGKEHVFEVIDAADLDDTHYMALVPYVEDEKQGARQLPGRLQTSRPAHARTKADEGSEKPGTGHPPATR